MSVPAAHGCTGDLDIRLVKDNSIGNSQREIHMRERIERWCEPGGTGGAGQGSPCELCDTVGAIINHCQAFPQFHATTCSHTIPNSPRTRILAFLLPFARKPRTAILQAPSSRCISPEHRSSMRKTQRIGREALRASSFSYVPNLDYSVAFLYAP